MMTRYLTKSRFKLAMECPAKLFYTGKPAYANRNPEDSFLKSLADSGYQVGELAKQYYPDGLEVSTLDYDDAIRQTNDLLARESVIIFEAAFGFEKLFVRADIVIKHKNCLELIEVKSKGAEEDGAAGMISKRDGELSTKWLPYIRDIAFQKYVITRSFPKYKVTASLLAVDKNSVCPSDGLNQKFKIMKDRNGRTKVVLREPLTPCELET